MSGILTIARLVFKDSAARDKAIEAFQKIVAFTTPNEPEVLQYVCALSVNDSARTEIYMIEEYANQAASDAHLATQPVQDLIQLFTTGDVLAGTPEVHNCPIRHKKCSGSPLAVSSNPAIVLVHTVFTILADWKRAAEEAHTFAKGLSTLVVEDKETDSVRVEYILQDWRSYEALQRSDVVKKASTGAQEMVRIKAIAGFLGREERNKL